MPQMSDPYLLLEMGDVPEAQGWLMKQCVPVIVTGEGVVTNADVVVANAEEVEPLLMAIRNKPKAALVLVQVLRMVEQLPFRHALLVESLAYGVLQAGSEYLEWLARREHEPMLISGGNGPPIEITRDGSLIRARLNRPQNRNTLTVEMRDALVELFELVYADDSIERLELSAMGPCFSAGGELREFGLSSDPANAHWVRSLCNPSYLLTRIRDRVICHVHSACIGSGIELPAFAARIVADRNSFFQLPELKFGLIPGAGGCVSVSRRIGRHRTAWMALSGKRIAAKTALDWGLVDEISVRNRT